MWKFLNLQMWLHLLQFTNYTGKVFQCITTRLMWFCLKKEKKASVKLLNKSKKLNWLLLRNICDHYPFTELLVRTEFLNRSSTARLWHCFSVVLQWFRCVLYPLPHSHTYLHPCLLACSKHIYPAFSDHNNLFCILSKTFAPSVSSGCASPGHGSLTLPSRSHTAGRHSLRPDSSWSP